MTYYIFLKIMLLLRVVL